MTAPTERRCPICQRPAAPPGERSPAPFCSPRCQMVDLGRWLNEAYVISEPVELEDPGFGGSNGRNARGDGGEGGES